MKVNQLDIPLHGEHRIGYVTGRHGYLACWRKSSESWIIGHIYVDSVSCVEALAKQCIDWRIVVDAEESRIGRKLSLDELVALNYAQEFK